MACCLLGTKPSEPMLAYGQLDPNEHYSVKFELSNIFIQENTFQNVVCKMASISPQIQLIKPLVTISCKNIWFGQR